MVDYLSYLFVRFGKNLFSILPYRLMYLLSDGIAWILRYLIRYRCRTSRENLKKAFPNTPDHEINNYLNESYRNFTDILLETLKGFTIPPSEIERRFSFTNPEHLLSYVNSGRSVVLTLGHTGNWEWAGLALGQLAPGRILCVYHRLKNPHLDSLILEERSRTGLVLYPKGETVKLIKHLSGINGAMMLAADQSPASAAAAKWVRFFNIETGFAPGPEVVSSRFGYPLVHMSAKRVTRGFYEATFHTLSDQPAMEEKNRITQLFADIVETEIRETPANWLWSHRRWKKQKPAQLKER